MVMIVTITIDQILEEERQGKQTFATSGSTYKQPVSSYPKRKK